MPKRSRLYNVAGLTNRQRRNILEQQQQAPGLNEVEDLQKAYGRLFNQVNKYASQLQNITNVARGLGRQVDDLRKTESAYKLAGRAALLYVRTAGRTIRTAQAFGRESRTTVRALVDTARASTGSLRAIRSYGASFRALRGNERPLQAITKVLQRGATVLNRTRRGAEQTRASFDLMRTSSQRFSQSFTNVNRSLKASQDVIRLLRICLLYTSPSPRDS